MRWRHSGDGVGWMSGRSAALSSRVVREPMYVVGVGRWALRVNFYAVLLVTDTYPPFSLR